MRPLPIIIAFFLAIAPAACSTLKSAKLWAPESFGMVSIAPQIYVDPAMEESARAELAEAINSARQRIRLYYGSILSDPEIIACSTEKCFQKTGGVTARAKAYGASKLLLSPRGQTAPMIAHEWSHAELHTRLNGYFEMNAIPRWFDEGLAVVVSNEPTHSEAIWLEIQQSGIITPMLSELETREKWMAAVKKYGDTSINVEQYKVVYATAGHEVRRWYRKAGRTGLTNLIESIRQNKPFSQAYMEAEGLGLHPKSAAYVTFKPLSELHPDMMINK